MCPSCWSWPRPSNLSRSGGQGLQFAVHAGFALGVHHRVGKGQQIQQQPAPRRPRGGGIALVIVAEEEHLAFGQPAVHKPGRHRAPGYVPEQQLRGKGGGVGIGKVHLAAAAELHIPCWTSRHHPARPGI